MKLSEIIAKLQKIVDEKGDLPGYIWDSDAQLFYPVEIVEIDDDPFAFVYIGSERDDGEIQTPRREP